MKKAIMFWFSACFVAAAVVALVTQPASAIKNFKEQFEAKYVKEDSRNPKEKAFAAAVEKAKCNVCHQGRSKKDRNAYGTALSVLLDKKEDRDDEEKIVTSFDLVSRIKANPADPKSPTFGELISQGKLPGGEPEEEEEK